MLVEAIQSRNPLGALQLLARKVARQSYAQDGEDLLLLNFLADSQTPGFYADVGAHHPVRFSNTLLFYLRGWRGINIDALPGSMALFNKWRPRDINLEVGISAAEGEMTYYMFNDPALNTFGEHRAQARDNQRSYKLIDKRPVPTKPLRAVFEQHVPPGAAIDFLSVDAEGMDLEVLKSNDWSRWRPSLVLAEETQARALSDIEGTDIGAFMNSIGYLPCAKTRISLLFAEESRLQSTDIGLQVERVAPSLTPATGA